MAGIGTDDGIACFERCGHSGLQGTVRQAQHAIGAAATLKEKSSIPVERHAQMIFHGIVLPVGACALAHDTDHFTVFGHGSDRTHPGRRCRVDCAPRIAH